jgi:hypothetical protein
MNDTTRKNQAKPAAQCVKTTENAGEVDRQGPLQHSTVHDAAASPQRNASRFEKYATTQAAGDGIQGESLKPNKTIDEKLGAKMSDRK